MNLSLNGKRTLHKDTKRTKDLITLILYVSEKDKSENSRRKGNFMDFM